MQRPQNLDYIQTVLPFCSSSTVAVSGWFTLCSACHRASSCPLQYPDMNGCFSNTGHRGTQCLQAAQLSREFAFPVREADVRCRRQRDGWYMPLAIRSIQPGEGLSRNADPEDRSCISPSCPHVGQSMTNRYPGPNDCSRVASHGTSVGTGSDIMGKRLLMS